MLYRAGKCLLRYRLAQRKMTQAQLAEKSGKSVQRVSDHVHERAGMSKETMYTYARILGCHMEDLHEWVYVGRDKE